MRIVLDTNVLVSAFLRSGGPPSRVLDAILEGTVTVVFDDRIIGEYRDVLARPKFANAIDAEAAGAVLDFLVAAGERVTVSGVAVSTPDPKDAAFLEVALFAAVDALVTGNRKDFPGDIGVNVLGPTEVAARL